MENYAPITPIKPAGYLTGGLIALGISTLACTAAAYYANRLSKKAAAIIAAIGVLSPAAIIGLHLRSRTISPIASKPFISTQVQKDDIPNNVKVITHSPASREERLQRQRGICKKFGLHRLLIPDSQIVDLVSNKGSVSVKALAVKVPETAQPIQELTDPEQIYQLATFIVKANAMYVGDLSLVKGNVLLRSNFQMAQSGKDYTYQGLIELEKIIPPDMVKRLQKKTPRLPEYYALSLYR